MNLSIFTPKYPPDVGGAATYSKLISDELADVGDIEAITIVTTTHPQRGLVERTGAVSVYRILPRTPLDGGLGRVLRFVIKQSILVMAFLSLSLRPGSQIFQIHSTMMFVGRAHYNVLLDWYLRGLSTAFGSVNILDVRDHHTIPENPRAFRLIICASESIRSRFLPNTAYSSKIITLPVPIDIENIKEHKTNTHLAQNLPDEYICFVGDISREKGVHRLVQAADVVENPTQLVIVGSPVDETGRDLLSSLPKSVRYLGPRSHDEALQIIEGAQLLILPSESEGMPRVALEALTLGTQVALTTHIPEFDSSESILKLPDNSVRTLAALLSNIPQTGRDPYPIETHRVEVISNRLCAYFRELVSQSSDHSTRSNEL